MFVCLLNSSWFVSIDYYYILLFLFCCYFLRCLFLRCLYLSLHLHTYTHIYIHPGGICHHHHHHHHHHQNHHYHQKLQVATSQKISKKSFKTLLIIFSRILTNKYIKKNIHIHSQLFFVACIFEIFETLAINN